MSRPSFQFAAKSLRSLSTQTKIIKPRFWGFEIHRDTAFTKLLTKGITDPTSPFYHYSDFFIEETPGGNIREKLGEYRQSYEILKGFIEQNKLQEVVALAPHSSEEELRKDLSKKLSNSSPESVSQTMWMIGKFIELPDLIAFYETCLKHDKSITPFDLPQPIGSFSDISNLTTFEMMAKRNLNFCKLSAQRPTSVNISSLSHYHNPQGNGVKDILKRGLTPAEFRNNIFLYVYSHEPIAPEVAEMRKKFDWREKCPDDDRLYAVEMPKSNYHEFLSILEQIALERCGFDFNALSKRDFKVGDLKADSKSR